MAQVNYQALIENYEDEDGRNPFQAAFSIWTFVKSVPLNVIKAIAISLGSYLIMTIIFIYFDPSWWLLLVSIIGGLVASIFLIVTLAVKLISDALLKNVSDLLMGILEPIEHLYDTWQDASKEELTKKEFTVKVFSEAVFPRLLDSLVLVPFKKTIKGRMTILLNNILASKEKDDAVEQEEEEDEADQEAHFLTRMINVIHSAINVTKRTFNAPFYFNVRIIAFCWIVIWTLHVIHLRASLLTPFTAWTF